MPLRSRRTARLLCGCVLTVALTLALCSGAVPLAREPADADAYLALVDAYRSGRTRESVIDLSNRDDRWVEGALAAALKSAAIWPAGRVEAGILLHTETVTGGWVLPSHNRLHLDAVATSIALTAANDRRTLILLFTDGVDTLSWLDERTVLETARSSEAVMYAVTLPEHRATAQPLMGDERQLKRLVEATGGRLLRADQSAQLRERFIEVLREMRARYVLTYTPTAPDTAGWHTLTVTLTSKKGRVASRAGYVVPAAEHP